MKLNPVVLYETNIVKNNLKLRSLFGLITRKEAEGAVDHIHNIAQEELSHALNTKKHFETRLKDGSTQRTIINTETGTVMRKITDSLGKLKSFIAEQTDGTYRKTDFKYDYDGVYVHTKTNTTGKENDTRIKFLIPQTGKVKPLDKIGDKAKTETKPNVPQTKKYCNEYSDSAENLPDSSVYDTNINIMSVLS